ncbi:hypothetical protein WA026_000523 [Henosepilachna vigintioctopunctata]|uniref:Uncharacterized protein n=1 Tax=Henosepilachna vigintioctopunctata TaxID=420089 RepID=A0AAW1UYR5_9CUCU
MYHVRNLMGSTKNAVLSAMRIPTQNLIIPSNYQIENINPEEITSDSGEVLGAINQKILSRSSFGKDDTKENYEQNNNEPSDPFGIVDTFHRVGTAIRDSVRSGQNTLSHIGDIAHNARKIYYSTKNTVPRVFIPYAKAPVLMMSRFKDDSKVPAMKKAVIITPKIMAIKEPMLESVKPEPNYVKMGNILDAIGISKPDKDKLDLERFVIKTPENGNVRGIYIPPIGDVKSMNGQEIPDLLNAKKTLTDHSYEKVSSSKNVKNVLEKIKKDVEITLKKTKNQVEHVKDKIANSLQYRKKTNAELANMLFKNKFKSYGDLESRVGNILEANGGRAINFTKEEEQKIIDTFLDNIFKMDKKHDPKSKSILYIANKNQSEEHSKNFERGLKDSGSQIEIKTPSSHGRSKKVNEMMKNLTLAIPIDEMESAKVMKFNSNDIKKNEIHKYTLHDNEKIYHKVNPEIVLESRFTDDNDLENRELRYPEELGEDDEDIKKVDEYVVNHIVSSKNLEQFKNDPSVEITDEFLQTPTDNVTPHSSRSLLSFPKDNSNNQLSETKKIYELSKPKSSRRKRGSLNDQVVGLNLPPELMKPFMTRASDKDIDKFFDSGGSNEVVGNARSEYLDVGHLGKRPYMFENDQPVNTQDISLSGVSPTYLIEQMRARAIATSKNAAEYTEYNPNLNSDAVNHVMEQPMYTYFDQEDGSKSLENSMRSTDSSEHTLCSPFSPYRNSPILCGNSYEYPHYLEQNEVENKLHEEKSGVGQSRTSMVVSDILRKPFMGLESKDAVKKFYEEYNGAGFMDHSVDSVEHELFSDY